MLHSLSTKSFFAILAALIFAVALVGIVYKYVEQRERMRMHAAMETGGDPRRGEAMFIQYGCGSCHAVSGVRTATGMVGPPLDGVALRVIIGGHLANNPPNMQRWIQRSAACLAGDSDAGSSGRRDRRARHHCFPLHPREIAGAQPASESTRQSPAPIRTRRVPQRTHGLRQRRSITRARRLERRWPMIRQMNRAITPAPGPETRPHGPWAIRPVRGLTIP